MRRQLRVPFSHVAFLRPVVLESAANSQRKHSLDPCACCWHGTPGNRHRWPACSASRNIKPGIFRRHHAKPLRGSGFAPEPWVLRWIHVPDPWLSASASRRAAPPLPQSSSEGEGASTGEPSSISPRCRPLSWTPFAPPEKAGRCSRRLTRPAPAAGPSPFHPNDATFPSVISSPDIQVLQRAGRAMLDGPLHRLRACRHARAALPDDLASGRAVVAAVQAAVEAGHQQHRPPARRRPVRGISHGSDPNQDDVDDVLRLQQQAPTNSV